MSTSRKIIAALAAFVIATLGVTSGSDVSAAPPGGEATYSVEFRNITSGQYLTPPNFAAHVQGAHVFRIGHASSPGVQAVAENGQVPVLAAELAAAIDAAGLGVSGVGGAAPIGPGDAVTFEVTTSESRLSIVSMLVCTNDGFAGLESKRLPRHEGQSKTYYLHAYDAGAEMNTELRADLVPAPFCGDGAGNPNDDPSIDEAGIVRHHRTLRGTGDLPASFDWSGPVVAVTVTNNG